MWTWPLVTSGRKLAELGALLSAEELGRAARLGRSQDKDDFVVAHGQMRLLLATYGTAPPQSLVFIAAPAGKPELAAGPQFNLSHSGGMAALAVCPDRPVGIDIEAVRPVNEAIAGRFFSAAENRALEAISGQELRLAFFRCWTRKEAVLKAIGCGLSRDPRSFSVPVGCDVSVGVAGVEPNPEADQDWSLRPFEPGEGLTGAIAIKSSGLPVEISHHALAAV